MMDLMAKWLLSPLEYIVWVALASPELWQHTSGSDSLHHIRSGLHLKNCMTGRFSIVEPASSGMYNKREHEFGFWAHRLARRRARKVIKHYQYRAANKKEVDLIADFLGLEKGNGR